MSEYLDKSEQLEKIREVVDGDDNGEYPSPNRDVEYKVLGNLRADILRRMDRDPSDENLVVRLEESGYETGYSEYTPEWNNDLKVWIDEGDQSQMVFDTQDFDTQWGRKNFFSWIYPN